MNCDETVERLYEYLDRELTLDEIAEVKRHLEACPPCLQMFRYEDQMRRLVRQACCESAPEYLKERILQRRP
jgi:mycothiol system anti-sigma-R factor